MAIEYLKKAEKTAATGEQDVREIVQGILDDIEQGGDEAPPVPKGLPDKLDRPPRGSR